MSSPCKVPKSDVCVCVCVCVYVCPPVTLCAMVKQRPSKRLGPCLQPFKVKSPHHDNCSSSPLFCLITVATTLDFDFFHVKTTSSAPVGQEAAVMKATHVLHKFLVCVCVMEWKKRGEFAYIYWVNQMTGNYSAHTKSERSLRRKRRTCTARQWLFVFQTDLWESREMEWLESEGREDERREESLSDQGDAMIG